MSRADFPYVVVAVPTYRRTDQLIALLDSLVMGTTGVADTRIDVLDNEPSKLTEEAVARWAEDNAEVWVEYVESPQPGIAAVRNHALSRAHECEYLAFVDDDETVPPYWLRDLLDAAARYNADVAVGPVRSRVMSASSSFVFADAYAFDEPSVESGTVLPWCATNNTLVNRRARSMVPDGFSEDFSATGGSDNHYFFRATVAGARIVWTQRPAVDEVVADSRVNARWLLKRAYRGGAVRSRVESAVLGGGRPRLRLWALKRAAKGLGGIAVGSLEAALGLLKRDSAAAMRGLLRLAAGAGTLGGFVGLYGVDYRRPPGGATG